MLGRFPHEGYHRNRGSARVGTSIEGCDVSASPPGTTSRFGRMVVVVERVTG
jgi:hypothetical protein